MLVDILVDFQDDSKIHIATSCILLLNTLFVNLEGRCGRACELLALLECILQEIERF